MRRKKGFTLIELLAVIAILTVLVIIALPSVIKLFNQAKAGIFTYDSRLIYKSLMDNYKKSEIDGEVISKTYTSNDDNDIKKPDNLDYYVEIDNNKVKIFWASTDEHSIYLEESEITIDDINSSAIYLSGDEGYKKVTFGTEEEDPITQVADSTPASIAGSGTTASPYLIESIEDLVTLSNTVNAGTTYSGKEIKLIQNLDFANSKSYMNSTSRTFGDINNNGVEEDLIVELTTDGGFRPIGNYSTSVITFRGIFNGNNKTIYNLKIKRASTDYVGFIGYNEGSVLNLNIINSSVEGKKYVGTIAGYNYNSRIQNITGDNIKVTAADNDAGGLVGLTYYTSVVSNINFTNLNVTGLKYIGGIVGYAYGGLIDSVIASGTIIGNDSVGGLVGYVYSGVTFKGINNGANVTSVGTNIGRIAGSTYPAGYTIGGLSLSSAKLNGSTITETSPSSKNGASINALSDINNLNIAEVVYDTYIGGDNDGDGYYYDYNELGKIVNKNTTDNPFPSALTGNGDTSSPYIINNYSDLKKLTLNLGKVYKLNSDIDLQGADISMLSSYTTYFTGTLDGNNKTISNFKITAPNLDYVGLIGYNKGTVKNLKLNNVEIQGQTYTGAITGYNYLGAIQDVEASNIKVTSTSNYAGGLIGYNNNAIKNFKLSNIEVNGANYVGSIAGYNYDTTIKNVSGDTIKVVASGNFSGGLIGYNYAASAITSNIKLTNLDVRGQNYVGGAIGYLGVSSDITSAIVKGTVSGNDYIGGIAGHVYNDNTIKAINNGVNITGVGTHTGRIYGAYTFSQYNVISSLALSTVTKNDSTVSGGTLSNSEGLDASESDLTNQTTYTNIGFNFTDETQECIWYFDNGVANFRKGTSY